MNTSTKKDEILNCAQMLIQARGYNGFSYADIAAVVGIRKASIHHYFPTKEDLAVAVIGRYRESFNMALSALDSEKNWTDKIKGYVELYRQVLSENKLCLCGMLASDAETLPDKAKQSIQWFFLDNIHWLKNILKNIDPKLSEDRVHNLAWQIINILQGAVLTARILKQPVIFISAYDELMIQLRQLCSKSP